MTILAGRGGSGSSGLTRALFIICTLALLVFGTLMIYSASAIEAMHSQAANYSSWYYLKNQVIFGVIGLVGAYVVSRIDYRVWRGPTLYGVLFATDLLLVLTRFSPLGSEVLGAKRWLSLGFTSIQPSEFAKIAIILAAAEIAQRLFQDGSCTFGDAAAQVGLFLLIPLGLILIEPDKGTTAVCAATLLVMVILAGVPFVPVACIGAGLFGVLLTYSWFVPYARSRIMMTFDPWIDRLGEGYQLIQGLYAFATGGIWGVGIGASRQKYDYLPMAYNDFIYPVIGEELGLVGTLLMLALFVALLVLGYKIASSAPDMAGALIAAGAVSLLFIQMLLNVCGVICLLPMSGKPIPLVSYGGSSVVATLMLLGLVVSVSRVSGEVEEASSPRRTGFTLYEGERTSGSGLRVLNGGGSSYTTTPDALRSSRDFSQAHASGRTLTNPNGTRRIDLGPSASDRLRGRGGTDRGGRG